MQSNDMPKKKVTDPVARAVIDRMSSKGKGFFIISVGPWVHPLNTVLNCYAIMFDGFVQYKFELLFQDGKLMFKVAEIRSAAWLTLKLIVGQTLTQEQLIAKIQEG